MAARSAHDDDPAARPRAARAARCASTRSQQASGSSSTSISTSPGPGEGTRIDGDRRLPRRRGCGPRGVPDGRDYALLETLAAAVAATLLGDRFPASRVRVRVAEARRGARPASGACGGDRRAPVTLAFAFGDVHGHLDPFAARLHDAGLVDSDLRWSGGDATLWLTGDLVRSGPARSRSDRLRHAPRGRGQC